MKELQWFMDHRATSTRNSDKWIRCGSSFQPGFCFFIYSIFLSYLNEDNKPKWLKYNKVMNISYFLCHSYESLCCAVWINRHTQIMSHKTGFGPKKTTPHFENIQIMILHEHLLFKKNPHLDFNQLYSHRQYILPQFNHLNSKHAHESI